MPNNKLPNITKEFIFFFGILALYAAAAMLFHLYLGLGLLLAGVLLFVIYYFVFVKRKIRKSKCVLKALSELRKRLEIDTQDTACVLTDRRGNITWYNQSFLLLINTIPD